MKSYIKNLNTSLNSNNAISFLQRLINVNSVNPTGNELEVAEVIAKYTKEAGLRTEIKPLTKNRANILVYLEGKDPTRAPLVFSGHLDTVPIGENSWTYDPFSGQIVDGKLYGRGACDMKGGVAALIEAMIILKNSSDKPASNVIFAGTAGEEVDCIGASELIKDGSLNEAGAMIIAEPSSGKVFSAHKGALWIEITVFGKTAHSSMPNQGTNAIVHMQELLYRIKKYDFTYTKEHHLLGKTSLNISTIKGGVKTNVVPDRCTVTIDIRTIPGLSHQKIINDIKNILEKMRNEIKDFDGELIINNNLSAVSNEENDQFVKLALDVNYDLYKNRKEEKGANYYTDASIFSSSLNIPIVIYGPGNENLAHQPDEYIDIEMYLNSISYYVELAKRY